MTKYTVKYPYIRANGHIWHSHAYWTENQIARATKDNAPEDAVFMDIKGKWITMSEMKERSAHNPTNFVLQDTIEKHEAAVEQYIKKEA